MSNIQPEEQIIEDLMKQQVDLLNQVEQLESIPDSAQEINFLLEKYQRLNDLKSVIEIQLEKASLPKDMNTLIRRVAGKP